MKSVYVGKSSTGRVKIGIARNVKTRWRDIDRSTPGSREMPTFAVKVFFAYQVEQFLRRLFWLFRDKHTGSGKTEWFRFFFPLDWIAVTLAVVILIVCRLLTVAGVLLALIAGAVMIFLFVNQ